MTKQEHLARVRLITDMMLTMLGQRPFDTVRAVDWKEDIPVVRMVDGTKFLLHLRLEAIPCTK